MGKPSIVIDMETAPESEWEELYEVVYRIESGEPAHEVLDLPEPKSAPKGTHPMMDPLAYFHAIMNGGD